MAARVVINKVALFGYLETNPGVQAALGATAEAVKAAVVDTAPVGKSLSWPGRRPIRHGWFKNSIQMRKQVGYFTVYSTDPFGAMVEYGSANNPAYAPFRRTMRRFGGIEHPKGSTKP